MAAEAGATEAWRGVVDECLAQQTLDKEAIANVLKKQQEASADQPTQPTASSEKDLSLLYGDTPPASVWPTLRAINESVPAEERLKGDGTEVFVDIGSGRGHVCFGAAAFQSWAKVAGVELVEAHVQEANKARDKLGELEKQPGKALATSADKIEFHCCDALRTTVTPELLKAATVVYCFDLAFPRELRQRMACMFAEFMKEGSFLLVTHMEPLPSVDFVQVGAMFSIDMEWGAAPARLFRKGPGTYEAWLSRHESQLSAAKVPRELWKSVCAKMIEQNFDIGQHAQFAEIVGCDDLVMLARSPMKRNEIVFIVDHAWSFASKEDAAASLEHVEGLRARLEAMAPPAAEAQPTAAGEPKDATSLLLDRLKPVLGSYTVVADPSKPDERDTVYYMLDEIGTRIRRKKTGLIAELHEGEANFRIVPVYSHDYRMFFSLAWPIRDIAVGDMMFADHEQGWDKDAAEINASSSTSAMLPEMKEFAAQAALQQLIDAQVAASSAAPDAEPSGAPEPPAAASE